MADGPGRVDSLFDQYVAAFRAGRGDVHPFLDQVDGEDREDLVLMIQAFVETDPEPVPTPENLRESELVRLTSRVTSELGGAGGGLSRMLVSLRQRLRLHRADVVETLANDLEAQPAEKEKIDGYYHDLEWGTLPSAGVADRVFESLAAILETTVAELRAAGRELGPGRSASGSDLIFTRTVPGERDDRIEVTDAGTVEGSQGAAERRADPPDRIDQLFTDV